MIDARAGSITAGEGRRASVLVRHGGGGGGGRRLMICSKQVLLNHIELLLKQ